MVGVLFDMHGVLSDVFFYSIREQTSKNGPTKASLALSNSPDESTSAEHDVKCQTMQRVAVLS